MAIIWQKKVNGTSYEVRGAGRTRRLYTNGVCHSEFNPRKIVTGSIWDLLILPAFFHDAGRVRRVLVLGVGGGAVLLQLRVLLAPECIVGVEDDDTHLYIARRFFGAADAAFELVRQDARRWVEAYDGRKFDLIIDDLYIDSKRQPVRALAADGAWFEKLLRHLRRDGVLVLNFGSRTELFGSGYFDSARVNGRFESAFQFTSPQLDNVVGAFLRRGAAGEQLRRNLENHPVLVRALRERSLRYRMRNITG